MNEKVYSELKRMILFLELKPGEVIDEKKIAADFNMSRTPIREVLQRLEWEGFVEIIPRGLISVSTLEFTKIKHTFFLRVQMESLAGKLAAANGYPKHIAQLQSIVEEIKGKGETISLSELVEFDFAFREILYDATDNPVLKQVSDNLYEQTLRLWMSQVLNDQTNLIMKRDSELLIEEIETTIESIEQKDLAVGESKRREIFLLQIKRTTENFMKEIAAF